jgi:GNAT superfamily N-acetyltransferase
MSFDIRPMSRADLDVALGWARDEGWNPGLDDADPFYAQDPTGFLMGWLDGEPIACISVVKYGDSFAFLGLYIVSPKWRGRGYGKAIWDAGIASAGSRTIGLDGVVAQQGNYRKSGFVLAHRSARWGGVMSDRGSPDLRVRTITLQDLPAIDAFDGKCFPAPRASFLSKWLTESALRQSMCYAANGRIQGYGTIRRAVEGFKVGPLFAETPEVAESLLYALAVSATHSPVFIDIPEPSEGAAEIARRAGLTPSFETARMYRGTPPAGLTTQTFGVTSLELG